MIDLGDRHRGRRLTISAERCQSLNFVSMREGSALSSKSFLSVGLDLGDLVADQR